MASMNAIFALETKAAATHSAKLATVKSLTEAIGYSVLPLQVSATDTPEQTRLRINGVDPKAQAYVWAFGPMQKPWCGPQAPDGHEQAPWASLLPWQTVASNPLAGDWANVWAAGGSPSMGWGAFYIAVNPMGDMWRPGIGATDASAYAGVDADAQLDIQLDLIIAHLRGQSAYLREGFICDHLEYPASPVHGLGNSLAAQLTAAGWTYQRNDSVDHDPQDLPAGSPEANAYFDELAGKQYGVLLYDSGGENFSRLFYIGTTDGVERAKPKSALVMSMGSTLGQVWEPEDIVRAFNFYALGSVWIGRVMPDVSLWLTGQETTGDMVRRHSQRLNATYVALMGFPLIKWNPSSVPPITTGATPLSDQQITAINASVDTKIAAMHDQLQADYTAKIAAAVLAIQTSQGQTGTPTGTVPPTGTSGTPPTGTGAAPALVINCGAADSLYAKSGLVWFNLPDASVAINLASVALPLPIAVYHSGRGGPRAEWAFPGYPSGALAVRLDFNEPHWALPGNRLQDVAINGVKVLSGFDIVSVTGAMNKAISKSFTAQIGADGVLSVVLTATPGSPDTNTYLCGIGIG